MVSSELGGLRTARQGSTVFALRSSLQKRNAACNLDRLTTDQVFTAAPISIRIRLVVPNLVICGDSVATSFGLQPKDVRAAFPQVMRSELSDHSIRVISLSRAGAMISDSARQVDRITGNHPDVIVLFHGGRESLYEKVGLLKRLCVDPHGSIGTGWKAPLRSIKKFLFCRVLSAMSSPLAEPVAFCLGTRPHMRAKTFEAMLDDLVSTLLHRTNAHIIVLQPAGGRMSIFPWSTRTLEQIRLACSRSAETDPRISAIDMRELLNSASDFQSDGVHLSVRGHRKLAHQLIRLARDIVTAPQAELPSL